MSVEVKFQQSQCNGVRAYTGDISKWPDGVYQCTESHDSIVVFHNRVISILVAGYIHPGYTGIGEDRTSESWVRISDDPRITSITFAGSMNYPDGNPEGGAS